MFGLGVTELLVIMVIVFVLFGAGKLPEVGKALGRGIRAFKNEMNGLEETINSEAESKVISDTKSKKKP
ncbi:MAG: twin-arginine translocase TatA/TatE family subunit [Candidatus Margulisiibacteriota bacterium]